MFSTKRRPNLLVCLEIGYIIDPFLILGIDFQNL